MYKKVILALAGGWVLASSPARAQSINGVHIYTVPAGNAFYVDGQSFCSSADFPWPATSKHEITSVDRDNTVRFHNLVMQLERAHWRHTLAGCKTIIHPRW